MFHVLINYYVSRQIKTVTISKYKKSPHTDNENNAPNLLNNYHLLDKNI